MRTIGFDGVCSIEIFRPEYWQQDPRKVAYTARIKAAGVLEKAGFTIDG
ncbi:MAG TPA: hypothetical protein VJP07_11065 [Dehalococcoidia bacterium]|nr:hypothetical protein [Dehalococcoidia bacterium]